MVGIRTSKVQSYRDVITVTFRNVSAQLN